jgi:hypothetical protein
VKPSTCPTCGHTNDAATFIGVGQYQPNAGDISVCIKCTAIATFTGDDLEVRKATLDELAVFENLPPGPAGPGRHPGAHRGRRVPLGLAG